MHCLQRLLCHVHCHQTPAPGMRSCLTWYNCTGVLQDEAVQLTGGPSKGSVDAAAELLAQHCAVAAVTLGERGCLVADRCGARLSEPAVAGVHVVDSTGGVRPSLKRQNSHVRALLFANA